ncbi:MAG: nucleotidyltransferase family protein [Desulfobacterales bacterium]
MTEFSLLAIENKILNCCAAIDPDGDQLQKVRGYMSDSVDMDRLIGQAIMDGMGGLLYKNFLKAGLLETINPRHKQKLYTVYYLTVRNNVRFLHALNTVLEGLNQEGIDIVLLQGMALLHEVYRDVGLRPMKDMDLWVLPKGYQLLAATLVRQGFSRDPLYPNTFRKGQTVLDVHTHILWADRIKSRAHLLSMNQDEIFHKAVEVNLNGRKTLCLNRQDQFLYLGLHALKHNFERLIWLVDIKSLVGEWIEPDWVALIDRADDLGHRETLLYILYLLKNIFDIGLPAGISKFLNNWKPGFLEKIMLHRRINGRSIPSWAQLILISNGRKFGQRFSFFCETLFPRPQILRQVFANTPQLSVPQLYWKRVLQVIGIHRSNF